MNIRERTICCEFCVYVSSQKSRESADFCRNGYFQWFYVTIKWAHFPNYCTWALCSSGPLASWSEHHHYKKILIPKQNSTGRSAEMIIFCAGTLLLDHDYQMLPELDIIWVRCNQSHLEIFFSRNYKRSSQLDSARVRWQFVMLPYMRSRIGIQRRLTWPYLTSTNSVSMLCSCQLPSHKS